MARELLFSLTRKDFRVEYIRGSGKGGQAKNKTSNACRITHIESGAQGFAQDTRSREQNKALAFRRMCETATFQTWFKKKCAELLLTEDQLQREVANLMRPENLLVEVGQDGEWVKQ